MDVSIVIVSYNTIGLLRNCLNSVISNTSGIDYEIIVIDNNSSDGSLEMLNTLFPQVKLIKNTNNVGFGRANNIGYKVSQGKYIFFLNSDTVLLDNAVKNFFCFMEDSRRENIFACGGMLVNEEGEPILSCGNLPSITEMFVHLFRIDIFLSSHVKNKIFSGLNAKLGDPYEVELISGADFFLRRSCIIEDALFDEDFFLYFEETELCYRMKKRGYKAIIIPNINIIHLCGKSSSDWGFQKIEVYEKSKLLYFRKCHGKFMERLLITMYFFGYLIRYLLAFRKIDYLKFTFFLKLFAERLYSFPNSDPDILN